MKCYYYFHGTGGETEVLRSEVICPSPHGYKGMEPGPRSNSSLISWLRSLNRLAHRQHHEPSLYGTCFPVKNSLLKIHLHLSAAQPPQILSRKRRPNLGRLTVSPEMQNPRAAGDRSRQKPRLPAKAPALRGPGKDPRLVRLVLRERRTCCYLMNSLGV